VPPGRYTLSATAWEPVTLLAIPSSLLRRAIDLNPDMGLRIMRCLSEIMARRLQQVTIALSAARETPLRERPPVTNPLIFESAS
jgi:CRP-like cAMP-binding protein